MSAVAAPRLSAGVVASVVLHGGLIAAALFIHPAPPPPTPPIYRVSILAGPAGPRAVGVVQETPPATPPETPPAPLPKAEVPHPTVPSIAPKPAVKKPPAKATSAAPPVSKIPAKTPQPTAGGGPTGGKGADVATVQTGGIEFPYPYYLNNIMNRLIVRFGTTGGSLTAKVRFVIKRDGSVDPESIHIVESSRNYSFDQRALGAVEAAGNAKDFGPLPAGFREDILPVTFSFEPASLR